MQLALDVVLLQAAQPLERVGDVVEGLQHLGLELGLDRGKRHRVLEIVLVEVGVGDRGFLAGLLAVAAAPLAPAGLNGVAAGGADGGATACGGCGTKPGAPGPARLARSAAPSGADRGATCLASGPA